MKGRGTTKPSQRVSLLYIVFTVSLGCAEPPPQRTVERRLDEHSFSIDEASHHNRVMGLQGEARPIVAGPRKEKVGSVQNVPVKPDEVTKAVLRRRKVDLDPDSHIDVTVHRLGTETDGRLTDAISNLFHSSRLPLGTYQIYPSKKRIIVLVTPDGAQGAKALNITLNKIIPAPPELTSEWFDVSAGARLEVEYGLRYPKQLSEGEAVSFTTKVECEDVGMVENTTGTAQRESSGWHAATLDLPEGRRCRVHLEHEGPSRAGATWGVPRIMSVPVATEPKRPNVILISLDTLRADHLSSHGYGRKTTPVIDSMFGAGGTMFTNAHSTYPLTNVAHLGLFTSLYPAALPSLGGLEANHPTATLAERFRDHGYRTAAFTEDALLGGNFGFWFGFDHYVEHRFQKYGRGEATFADGLEFLRQHGDAPFFLFLHTYKTHDPYITSPEYEDLFGEGTATVATDVPPENRDSIDAYDRTIREVDDQLGTFLEGVERLGLSDETIVVVVSDHGEAFGEHGVSGHGKTGHQEQLRVPFLLRGPGISAGQTIDLPVSLVDVGPTILALTGLPPAEGVQGRSLVPALRGETLEPKPLLFGWLGNGIGLRSGDWKLMIRGEQTELFDLAADPSETTPVEGGPRDEIKAEFDAVRFESAQIRKRLKSIDQTEAPAISNETRESLEALGYL